MIAEPYICIKGEALGDMESFDREFVTPFPKITDGRGTWIPYADFEREKLKDLNRVKSAYCGFSSITVSCQDCYWVLLSRKDCMDNKCRFPWQILHGDRMGEKQHAHHYGSAALTGYRPTDFDQDSESNRLLKRAEFLKAVCEHEGVEWLPKECRCLKSCPHVCKDGEALLTNGAVCPCSCHQKGKTTNEYHLICPDCGYDRWSSDGFEKCPKCHQKPEKCSTCGKWKQNAASVYKIDRCDCPTTDYFTRDEEKAFRAKICDFIEKWCMNGRRADGWEEDRTKEITTIRNLFT